VIVSHKHKFILLKSYKTASTSIEDMLRPHIDEGELYPEAKQHMSPTEVRNDVGEEVWNSYFKILPVRNPWDAVLSLYFFNAQLMNRGVFKDHSLPPPPNFNYFVKWNMKGYMPLNKCFDKIGDDVFVPDMVIRFEKIHEDCKELMDIYNLPFEGVPRSNSSSYRPKGLHYSMMYDIESKALVERVLSHQVKTYNYKFEHWWDTCKEKFTDRDEIYDWWNGDSAFDYWWERYSKMGFN
jgi:hypothetical protein